MESGGVGVLSSLMVGELSVCKALGGWTLRRDNVGGL